MPVLQEANTTLDLLRHDFRACHEAKALDLRRYEFASRAVDEIGRLVGGALRALHP